MYVGEYALGPGESFARRTCGGVGGFAPLPHPAPRGPEGRQCVSFGTANLERTGPELEEPDETGMVWQCMHGLVGITLKQF